MSKQVYKFYDFKCQECTEEFNKGMWSKGSEQDGVNCPSCDVKVFYEAAPEVNAPMLNTRENWKKKIPSDYKKWMETTFTKRHSSDSNINMVD